MSRRSSRTHPVTLVDRGIARIFFACLLFVCLLSGCEPNGNDLSMCNAPSVTADINNSIAPPTDVTSTSKPSGSGCGFDEALFIEPDDLLAIIVDEEEHAFYQIVDIRSASLFEGMHVPYSISIPRGGQFALRIEEIHFERTIILVGHESYDGIEGVLEVLHDAGGSEASIRVLRGGYEYWGSHGYPVTFELRRFC